MNKILIALLALTISLPSYASSSFLTENLPKSFKYATEVKGKPNDLCIRADESANKYYLLTNEKDISDDDHVKYLKLSSPPLKFLKANCDMFILQADLDRLSNILAEQFKYFKANKIRPPIPNYGMNPYD